MTHNLTIELHSYADNIPPRYHVVKQPTDTISSRDRSIYELVNYFFISGTVALFGLLTNVINIIVFYNQGFKSTVNISFFALAISDVCNLMFVIWFGFGLNPLIDFSSIGISAVEIVHLTAGLPHICFARITGWITVFITAERCLCIALPLKIKQIVTPARTTLIIFIIYLSMISVFVPEYATSYHCWKFHEIKNLTLLGLCFTSGHDEVNNIFYFLHSILGSASCVDVVIFTSILITQLKLQSKWRMEANSNQEGSKTISNRDMKAMTMVVMISTVLIVCYMPGVIASMLMFFVQDFDAFGAYANTTYVIWSFVFVFETLNSSINIFFYYKMSVKFRETVRLLAPCWNRDSTMQTQMAGNK